MDITSYVLGKAAGGGGTPNLQAKDVEITENGNTNVSADTGYDGLSNVGITTNVQPDLESKSVTITTNTTTTVTPTTGKDGLSSVEVITNVPGIVPTGTINITSNNIYDVTNYASANVNVEADMSEYFNTTITSNTDYSDTTGVAQIIKKIPEITIANNVSSLHQMFVNWIGLGGTVKLKGGNITRMTGTFSGCNNILSIDLSELNFGNIVSDGLQMAFMNCNKVTQISGISNLTTTNVTNLQGTFSNCKALTSLDLSNWNTDKVTTMQTTFSGCSNLASLNLSGWTTTRTTNTNSMFAACGSLQHLDIRNFTFSGISNYTNMFGVGTTSNPYVPADCEIIVKDATEKTWLNTNFSRLTNVKTVAEYEA
jgi:surface protein